MAKLPFVIQPRRKPIRELVGSEDAGYISIERRGYLSAGEKAFLQTQMTSDNVTRQMLSLVRQVALDKKLDQEKAYALLQEVITGSFSKESKEVADQFKEEIDNLMSEMIVTQERRRLVTAFCMLIYRVDDKIDFDQVLDLHPDIIDALADLYTDEENRSDERLREQNEDAVEVIEKSGEDDPVGDLEKKS